VLKEINKDINDFEKQACQLDKIERIELQYSKKSIEPNRYNNDLFTVGRPHDDTADVYEDQFPAEGTRTLTDENS
jgi:hypothetical protein